MKIYLHNFEKKKLCNQTNVKLNIVLFGYRKQHRDDEHSGRRCKCYKCAKELMSYKSLESHLELVHGKDPNSRKVTINSEDGNHEEYHPDGTSIHQE